MNKYPFMTDELIEEAQETTIEDVIDNIKSMTDIFGMLGLIPILAYRIQALQEENKAIRKELVSTTILARRAN